MKPLETATDWRTYLDHVLEGARHHAREAEDIVPTLAFVVLRHAEETPRIRSGEKRGALQARFPMGGELVKLQWDAASRSIVLCRVAGDVILGHFRAGESWRQMEKTWLAARKRLPALVEA